uniref:Uncharacterized protein n=1 Tax=Anguilla anguilla TaxID=7936 RepID=A0A0E9PY90_ANGAN
MHILNHLCHFKMLETSPEGSLCVGEVVIDLL